MGDFFQGLPAPPVAAHRPANPRRKLYLWLGAGGGVLVLLSLAALLGVGVWRFLRLADEPKAALRTYTATLIRADYKGAYASTADEYRKYTGYDAFLQSQADLTRRLGLLKGARQNGWNIVTRDGLTTCTIPTTLQFERGTVRERFILLEGSDGAWRVLSFQELKSAGPQ